MLGISEILQNKIETGEKLEKSERAQITKEIYQIYTSPSERIHRRKENWARYCKWCKANKKPDSTENQKLFKKDKTFIKEQPIKTFVYFISHIETKHLYYIKSEMLDHNNRGKSASAWLLVNTRVK